MSSGEEREDGRQGGVAQGVGGQHAQAAISKGDH